MTATSPEPLSSLTGTVMGLPAHAARPGAIGEVHARPHPLIEAPRVLIQLSFMTEGGSASTTPCSPNCRAAKASPRRTAWRATMR